MGTSKKKKEMEELTNKDFTSTLSNFLDIFKTYS